MNWIETHGLLLAGGYFLFSAIIGGMPPLTPEDGRGYTWLYNSAHILAGNISTIVASKFQALQPGTAVATHTEQTTLAIKGPTSAV